MEWNAWIRQIHRWLSIVSRNRHRQLRGHGMENLLHGWSIPRLLPLFLLLFTGLYNGSCCPMRGGGAGPARGAMR